MMVALADLPDWFARHWDMLLGRSQGPLSARLIIQPLVAATLGIRAGLKDARAGQSPYGWLIVSN